MNNYDYLMINKLLQHSLFLNLNDLCNLDKYSKKITDFFDYYYLGETFEVKYEKLFYKKNDLITFTKSNNESQVISEWLSEILIRTETNYILINTEIQETVDI